MTDEESRKAFLDFCRREMLVPNEIEFVWQAAVGWEKDRIAPLLEECLDVIPCYVPNGPTDDILARLCAELGIDEDDDD